MNRQGLKIDARGVVKKFNNFKGFLRLSLLVNCLSGVLWIFRGAFILWGMSKNSTFLFLLMLCAALNFGVGCSTSGSELGVTVSVKPKTFRIPNGGTVQYSAEVSGTLQKGVTWGLTGPGSIDSQTGRYTAAVDGQLSGATILATSTDDTTAVGSGNITVTQFTKRQGEKLDPGVDELSLGGMFVRGQTVDLNGDGLLDLLTRSVSNGTLSFYGGQGSELFVKKTIPVNDPVAMLTGDFVVSDFLADVAIASGDDQKIVFYQALADTWEQQGLPASPGEISLSPRRPVSMAAGRFHDSHLTDFPISDLIVGTEDQEIVFFRQDRSVAFSFSEESSIPVGGRPTQMITGDFNLDALLDLAVVREGLSDVLILFGDGNGGFPSSGTVSFPALPTFLAKGFFNADASVDLVSAQAASNQIAVALGNADGSFAAPTAIALTSAPGTLTVGDFNVGGNDDIAIALPDSNAIQVLFGDGSGSFIGEWQYDAEGLSPATLISGFFTGFQAPQGNQSVELVYLGINTGTAPPSDQFFLLTNQNF